MAYTPNVWIDRQGTGLNKFKDQNDNTYFFTAVPDTVLQAGTPISAEWLNHMEQGIKENSDNIENFDSKFPVSIADGGTGATTSAAALSALGAAASGHKHSAADMTSGTLPVARGGTGGTSAAAARQSLKVPYCVLDSDGNYFGLGLPGGSTSSWIRTTENGFLPYASGNSSIGTPSWPFNYVYANHVYSPTFDWVTLWSGNVSSGAFIMPNAQKYAAIIICGQPGTGESFSTMAVPAGNFGTYQITSNLYYISFNIVNDGALNLQINIVNNPSGGSFRQVWGITRVEE